MKTLAIKDFTTDDNETFEATCKIWGAKISVSLYTFKDEFPAMDDIDMVQINARLAFIEKNRKAVVQGLLEHVYPLSSNEVVTEKQFINDLKLTDIAINVGCDYDAEINFSMPENHFGDHWIMVSLNSDNEFNDYVIQG